MDLIPMRFAYRSFAEAC